MARPAAATAAREVPREAGEVGGRPPRQGHLGNGAQLVAAGGHQARLEALFGAQGGDHHVRVAPPQAVGEGEQGGDVPGGPAPGEQDGAGGVEPDPEEPGTPRPAAVIPPPSRSPGGATRPPDGQHSRRPADHRRPCRQRLGAAGLAAGEGQQHPEGQHRGHQRGPSGGHQGQGHADDRQQADHRADVDDGLHQDPGHDPARGEADEQVVGPQHEAVADEGQHGEQGEDDQRPGQAELLADDRVDEVVVRLREPLPLLAAGAEADAPPAPSARA